MTVRTLVAIIATLLTTLTLAQPAATIRGIVFHDRNGNGVRDEGEPGLAGVAVSNQADVVSTDADGRYTLDAARGYGLVYVSVPGGWRTEGPAWRSIGSPEGGTADFALSAWPLGDDFSFLHISDPHVNEANLPRLEEVRRIVESRKPAFVLATGDLVKDALAAGETEARGLFELYLKAIREFPVPVWSALGNHDVFGIDRDASGVSDEHPLYEKRMYRHYLGPDYYAFNAGRLHFVALDTIATVRAEYYGLVDDVQLGWLERDVAAVPDGHAVVTFGHMPLLTAAPSMQGFRANGNGGDTAIVVNGTWLLRHVVNNPADVAARLARVRWPLSLAGHTHARETVVFEGGGQPTRFEQASSVAPTFPDPFPMVSGVTLYRVRGTQIDAGEFIRLGGEGLR